jgi:hypothetical protein
VTAPRMRERFSQRDVVALLALVLAGIGIPLGLAAAAGAVGVPSNDDWVYMRAATILFETGRVDVAGHTAAFIGQLALAQPLLWLAGGDPWALTAFGLVMAAIGIAATYLLARRFLGMGSAVLVVLLVVAFPGFVRESASFMTDVPAYALGVLCLLLGTRWLQGDGGRATLVAALVAGLLAASIREFAIAVLIAILVAAWARNRATERVWLVGLSIVVAAGLVGILAAATSMPGAGGARSPDLVRLLDLGPAFATLAAVLLPATGLYVGQRRANFSPKQIIFGAGLACLALIPPDGPFLGNLWTPRRTRWQCPSRGLPAAGHRRTRVGPVWTARVDRCDPRSDRGSGLGPAESPRDPLNLDHKGAGDPHRPPPRGAAHPLSRSICGGTRPLRLAGALV